MKVTDGQRAAAKREYEALVAQGNPGEGTVGDEEVMIVLSRKATAVTICEVGSARRFAETGKMEDLESYVVFAHIPEWRLVEMREPGDLIQFLKIGDGIASCCVGTDQGLHDAWWAAFRRLDA
jgi:hypothetical protein